MNIIIRADASTQMGTGHVMRCLALADELKAAGCSVEFFGAILPGDLIDFTASKGYKVHPVDTSSDSEEQILKILSEKKEIIDWMIFDHYGYDAKKETWFRKFAKKIMVIDDLANTKHDCDLLLDQNYVKDKNRYDHLLPQGCTKLLGTQYALLRPEFSEKRKDIGIRNGNIRRLLVFLGGSDPDNVTGIVLDGVKLLSRADIFIDVVIGSSNPHRENIEKKVDALSNASLTVQASNMAEKMGAADLCIGAGGATSWERMCLGLPTMAIVIAENQRKITEELEADGLVINLGWHKGITPERIKENLETWIGKPERIYEMSNKISAVVDGMGVRRVVDKMEEI